VNIALILAGGQGLRMGENKPKQFIDLLGKPIIIRTLEAFENHPEIDSIAVVCLKEWQDELLALIKQYKIKKVRWIIDAGENRRQSSYNGVTAIQLDCSERDIVLIHDAARPFVSKRIITENIQNATKYGACDTVIPTQDTIVKSVDGSILDCIPARSELYLVQTPQSFTLKNIVSAHENYSDKKNVEQPEITDDCGLLLFAGVPVSMVVGDKFNIKITSVEDLYVGKAIIEAMKIGYNG